MRMDTLGASLPCAQWAKALRTRGTRSVLTLPRREWGRALRLGAIEGSVIFSRLGGHTRSVFALRLVGKGAPHWTHSERPHPAP